MSPDPEQMERLIEAVAAIETKIGTHSIALTIIICGAAVGICVALAWARR